MARGRGGSQDEVPRPSRPPPIPRILPRPSRPPPPPPPPSVFTLAAPSTPDPRTWTRSLRRILGVGSIRAPVRRPRSRQASWPMPAPPCREPSASRVPSRPPRHPPDWAIWPSRLSPSPTPWGDLTVASLAHPSVGPWVGGSALRRGTRPRGCLWAGVVARVSVQAVRSGFGRPGARGRGRGRGRGSAPGRGARVGGGGARGDGPGGVTPVTATRGVAGLPPRAARIRAPPSADTHRHAGLVFLFFSAPTHTYTQARTLSPFFSFACSIARSRTRSRSCSGPG